MSIVVEVILPITIDLPEGDPEFDDTGKFNTEEALRKCPQGKRAIEAAFAFLPQGGKLYIDGKDKPPADVWVGVNDGEVNDIWIED